MPAAVASRGWMSRPAAGLGVGDTQGTEFCWGGGRFWAGAICLPQGALPLVQLSFSPLARAAVQTEQIAL